MKKKQIKKLIERELKKAIHTQVLEKVGDSDNENTSDYSNDSHERKMYWMTNSSLLEEPTIHPFFDGRAGA